MQLRCFSKQILEHSNRYWNTYFDMLLLTDLFLLQHLEVPKMWRLTSFSSFLPYLIFSIVVGSARGTVGQNGCSSACGSQIIMHPFHLRGDPSFCGVPEYELICDGNKTILELNPGKYYVTHISYENATLRVVDANLGSGQCRLPFRFPFVYDTMYDRYDYTHDYYNLISSRETFQLSRWADWATFVNCSKKIQNQTHSYYSQSYQYVPCLSGNNTFIYVLNEFERSGREADLLPSCNFLSEVPINNDNPEIDIFSLLQKGFTVEWGHGNLTRSRYQTIRLCLSNAVKQLKYDNQGKVFSDFSVWLPYPHRFGIYVLGCLNDNEKYTHFPYVNPYVFMVCFDVPMILLVIAALIRFIVAPLSIYMFLASEYWRTMVPIDSIEKFLRNQETLAPTRYAYIDVIAMTRHFKEKLGQGGFGSVYKGELPGGYLVAVKMLGNSKCNGEEFISEVSTIGSIHHLNVVRLVGFCSEGSKRALVYEFMPNGSLDKFIFSSNGENRYFTLEKLNEIALGVARGIDYLHRGCDMRILHFDIKPHNILLDQNFSPKVSDFGLAKLYPKEFSLVSFSVARGTIGYIAPELVSRSFGVISHKSDVYSFGMLLLEMAGGRRNVDHRAKKSSQVYYPSWIYDRLLEGEGPEICNSIEIDDTERKLCKVGLWCIQMGPSDRPSMSKVIEMLDADVQTLEMPPKPFVSASGPVSVRQSYMDSSLSELSIISEDE